MRRAWTLLLALCVAAPAAAVGPARVGVPDRSLWPEKIDTPAAFDRASRAEILAFASALSASESLDAAALQARLGTKSVDMDSVRRIRTRYWNRLLDNYHLANRDCTASQPFCSEADDLTALRRLADAFATAPVPTGYTAWREDALHFHAVYLDELLRLAALFPGISSEIDRFDASEIDGGDLGDRQFLLTFDDGPTVTGGDTDRTLAMLRSHGLHSTFFVLGDALQRRSTANAAAMTPLYAGMCVGIHGWEHKSHARWPEWQSSITRSAEQAKALAGEAWTPLFRPPYGQRRADSAAFFAEKNLRVMLWGIDSQDWNTKMTPQDVRQRMLGLLLLWRHGIILFHDIHPKAQAALPWVLQQTQGAGLDWVDCHDYPQKR